MNAMKKVKFSPAEKVFMRQFDVGCRLGEAAWKKSEPLSSCPFGPGLKNPDDAEDPRHMGWLCGWHECAIRERESKSYWRGFINAQTRARETDHYVRGVRDGLAAQRGV